jgi:hypothetical protein
MKPDLSGASSENVIGASSGWQGFAGAEIYQEHSFRIAELGVEATDRDFKRRLELVEAAEKAQLPPPAGPGRVFPLNPPADAHHLREIIQRLSSDPQRRVLEELFWFWPLALGGGKSDEALKALNGGDTVTARRLWQEAERQPEFRVEAEHNLVVLAHFEAIESERAGLEEARSEQREAYWQQSIERWRRVGQSEAVWSRLAERIRQLNDPRLKSGLSRRMQEWLPRGLLTIHGQLAVRYGQQQQAQEVQRHARLMRQCGFEEELLQEVLGEVTQPVRERVRGHCQNAQREVKHQPQRGLEVLQRLVQQTRGPLATLDALLSAADPTRKGARDEVGEQVRSGVVDYTKHSEDWAGAEKLLVLALDIALTAQTRERIEKDLTTVRKNSQETNWWYGPGYWQLNSAVVAELERAKKLLDEKNEAQAVDALVASLRALASDEDPIRPIAERALAYALNLKAVRAFNAALNRYTEDTGSQDRYNALSQSPTHGFSISAAAAAAGQAAQCAGLTCMICDRRIAGQFCIYTWQNTSVVACPQCTARHDSELEEQKSEFRQAIALPLAETILALELNPQSKQLTENLTTVTKQAQELGMQIPANALRLRINLGLTEAPILVKALAVAASHIKRVFWSIPQKHTLVAIERFRSRSRRALACCLLATIICAGVCWGLLIRAERKQNATGGLRVSTHPIGAAVLLIGGNQENKAPAEFHSLAQGIQTLKISMDGYEPVFRKVQITGNALTNLETIRLIRSTGAIQITTGPGNADYVLKADNSEVEMRGKTPTSLSTIPTGEYQLKLIQNGWPDFESKVTIKRRHSVAVLWDFAQQETLYDAFYIQDCGLNLTVPTRVPFREFAIALDSARCRSNKARVRWNTFFGQKQGGPQRVRDNNFFDFFCALIKQTSAGNPFFRTRDGKRGVLPLSRVQWEHGLKILSEDSINPKYEVEAGARLDYSDTLDFEKNLLVATAYFEHLIKDTTMRALALSHEDTLAAAISSYEKNALSSEPVSQRSELVRRTLDAYVKATETAMPFDERSASPSKERAIRPDPKMSAKVESLESTLKPKRVDDLADSVERKTNKKCYVVLKTFIDKHGLGLSNCAPEYFRGLNFASQGRVTYLILSRPEGLAVLTAAGLSPLKSPDQPDQWFEDWVQHVRDSFIGQPSHRGVVLMIAENSSAWDPQDEASIQQGLVVLLTQLCNYLKTSPRSTQFAFGPDVPYGLMESGGSVFGRYLEYIRTGRVGIPIQGANQYRRSINRNDVQGVVVAHVVPKYTPVRAAGDGRIVAAELAYAGWNVAIDSEAGDTTVRQLYGHIGGLARNMQSGRMVKQGEILGLVSTLGPDTGHYLFRLKINGKACDFTKTQVTTSAGDNYPLIEALRHRISERLALNFLAEIGKISWTENSMSNESASALAELTR